MIIAATSEQPFPLDILNPITLPHGPYGMSAKNNNVACTQLSVVDACLRCFVEMVTHSVWFYFPHIVVGKNDVR